MSSFLYTFLELETLLDDLESSTNSFLKWMERLRLGTMFLIQGHLSLRYELSIVVALEYTQSKVFTFFYF